MARPPAPPKGIVAVTVKAATAAFLDDIKVRHGEGGTLASKKVVMKAFQRRLGHEVLRTNEHTAPREGKERMVWTLSCGDFDDTMTWMIAGADEEEARERRENGDRARTGRKSKTSQMAAATTMRQFAEFCRRHNWLPAGVTLLQSISEPRKASLDERPEMVRFNTDWWPQLLSEAASVHQRARAIVALGLYSARRSSEIRRMRWRDIDWEHNMTYYYNQKGGRAGRMPLYPEFRVELELWYEWTREHYGEPDPEWFVIPARADAKQIRGANSRMLLRRDSRFYPLDPTRACSADSLSKDVRRVLERFGYGPNEGTGSHTWRRSAADAIAERFGMKAVQVVLGHKHEATSVRYVSEAVKDKMLFDMVSAGLFAAEENANVVSLSDHRRRKPRFVAS